MAIRCNARNDADTLTACGGPKADVSVFIMGPNGFPSEAAEKMEVSLKAKVGESPYCEAEYIPYFFNGKNDC